MEISLTQEQESQLAHLAAETGQGEAELARHVFSCGLAAEAHFISKVKIGQEAALRGEFVDQSDVWAGVESALRS
jgi:predicted transcriptional regulator